MTTRSLTEKCPWCGRFVAMDGECYYDTLDGRSPDDGGQLAAFCNKTEALAHQASSALAKAGGGL